MKDRPIIFSAPMVRAILDGTKTQTRRVVKDAPTGADAYLLGLHRPSGQWGIHADVERIDGVWRGQCPYGRPGDRLWVREAWQHVHPLQVAEGRYSQECSAGIPGPPPVDYKTIYRADGDYPRIHFDHPDGTWVEEWPYRSLCTGEACTRRHIHPEEAFNGWNPSIHMRRSDSRITLEVTGVRVERLHGISQADAIAEGVQRIRIGDGYEDMYSATERSWADAIERHPDVQDTACAAYRELWESINGLGTWNANPWVWVIEFTKEAKQ